MLFWLLFLGFLLDCLLVEGHVVDESEVFRLPAQKLACLNNILRALHLLLLRHGRAGNGLDHAFLFGLRYFRVASEEVPDEAAHEVDFDDRAVLACAMPSAGGPHEAFYQEQYHR